MEDLESSKESDMMSTTDSDSQVDMNWIREDSRDFYQEHLQKATHCKQRSRLLRFSVNQAYALKKTSPNALFLEFGVHQGKDITRIAAFVSALDTQSNQPHTTRTTVHGFDSFEGLPEDWKNGQYQLDGSSVLYKVGTFDVNGEAPIIDQLHLQLDLGSRSNPVDNVVFHKGWFDCTVSGFLDQHCQPVAFIHADADLYSSTKTFLEEICRRKLLRTGSIILFDEYWNFEEWQEGEFKAWREVAKQYDLHFCYLGIHAPPPTGNDSRSRCHYGYQSVCVMIQQDMK
jgi:hypothetical protein